MARGYPDFEGAKSGLYLMPEWAAKEGIDKTLSIYGLILASDAVVTGLYTVPAGKILYVLGFSFRNYAYLAADRDSNQIGSVFLYNDTTSTYLAMLGGNGGSSIVLGKSQTVASGEVLRYVLHNNANHQTNMLLTVWGYEV